MPALVLILALLLSPSALSCGSEVVAKATFDTGSGPFFPDPGMVEVPSYDLTTGGKTEGKLLVIKGRITGLDNTPRANSVVILWQADNNGFYFQHIQQMLPRQTNFRYIGVTRTNENGEYLFCTIRPPPYGPRSAHVHLATPHSDNRLLFTEVHFQDDETPEHALDLTSPEARDLIKTSTPGQVRFDGIGLKDVDVVTFDIKVN